MKRTQIAVISLLVVIIGVTSVLVFQNFNTSASGEDVDLSKRVSSEELSLAKGTAMVLPQELGKNEKPLTDWKSEDSSIASVDSGGRVDGIKQGSTTLTAKFSDGATYTCKINVASAPKEEKADLFSTAITANLDIAEKNAASKKSGASKQMPYRLHVNRKMNCVTAYTYDSDGKYTIPVRAMVCSCGLNNGTITGVYNVYFHTEWHPLAGGSMGQYATAIVSDYMFHSVPYKDYAKNTLKVDEYNKLGQDASQGCIRLAVSDCKWINDNCEEGTFVFLFDSDNPGPLGKPESIHLTDPSITWDPTDLDKENPFNTKFPQISGAKDITLTVGDSYKMTDNITATDTCGNNITDRLEIIGNAGTDHAGTYIVTYRVTDALHRTAEKKITVTVEDKKTDKEA